jgi:hypothetical protein
LREKPATNAASLPSVVRINTDLLSCSGIDSWNTDLSCSGIDSWFTVHALQACPRRRPPCGSGERAWDFLFVTSVINLSSTKINNLVVTSCILWDLRGRDTIINWLYLIAVTTIYSKR